MKVFTCVITALIMIAMAIPIHADPDAIDDTFGAIGVQNDLTDVTVVTTEGGSTFTCTFAHPIAPASADAPNSVTGVIDLDIDRDPTTGSTTCLDGWAGLPDVDLGVEYAIDIGTEMLHPGFVDIQQAPSFVPDGTFPITFTSNSFTVSLPPGPTSFNYGILVGNLDELTDRWPNNTSGPTRMRSVLGMPNNEPVWLREGTVTASFNDCFYVQSPDRFTGIKVLWPAPVPVGQAVSLSGVAVTTDGPERAIKAAKVTLGEPQDVAPLFVSQKTLGGWYDSPVMPLGFPGSGLYNVGLFVGTAGRVTYVDPAGAFVYIDDGSVLCDGNTFGPGSSSVSGVKVMLPYDYEISSPPAGFMLAAGVITTAPGPVRVIRAVELVE